MSFDHRLRLLGLIATAAVAAGPVLPVDAVKPAVEPVNPITCRYPENVHIRPDRWISVKGPTYDEGEGGAEIAGLVVSPNDHARMYVTNGISIKRSPDEGCTWEGPLFPSVDAVSKQTPDPLQPHLQADRITGIALAQQLTDNEHLWVLGYDHTNDVYRPHVWVSQAAQAASPTFVERSSGLPQAGRPLAIASLSANMAGVMIDVASPEIGLTTGGPVMPGLGFYSTINGGAQWTRQAVPQGFTSVDGLRPNPLAPNEYWAWQGSKFAVTLDLGKTWEPPIDTGDRINEITIGRTVTNERVVEIYFDDGQGGRVLRAVGSGEFRESSWPGSVVSAARAANSELSAVATTQGVRGFDERLQQWVSVGLADVGGLRGLTFPKSAMRPAFLLGYSGEHIYRFQLYKGNLFRPDPRLAGPSGPIRPMPPLTELPKSTLPGPTLATPVREVTVKPGQLATVPGEIGVPPTPIPLDIDFVVDTTASMQPTIDGLVAGIHDIVDSLTGLNIDVHFGIADFKDVGDVPGKGCFNTTAPRCMYRRLRTISPPGPDLVRALMSVRANVSGGGTFGDEPEAQTIALDQAVTGSGHEWVDRGLDARFRSGSIKVVVMVTDAYMKQGEQRDDGAYYPTIPEIVTTYTSRDVYLIGLVAVTNADTDRAEQDLIELAQGTGTLAPASGVDCNNDGNQDLEPFAPLVCRVPPSGEGTVDLTHPVVSLLLAIPDPGLIALEYEGATDVITRVRGTTAGVFNLKDETRLDFDLDVTCTEAQDGQDLGVALHLSVRGIRRASTSFVVQCRADPKPPPPVIFIPPLPPPPVIVPPPPPPAPPPPAPNPPPNPNPNINPNTGFAQQEEQQYQLATVGQSESEQQQEQDEEAVELAMVGLEHEEPSPVPLWAASMVMTGAAAAVAMRRRTQRATVRVRNR